MEDDLKRLCLLFKKLGARNPEGWAQSQLSEGIPQVARFLFLRQAWRHIVSDADTSWIDASLNAYKVDSEEPYAAVGRAIEKLQMKGATEKELTDLVRGMQAELLFRFCYLLEDPGEVEEEVSDIAWGLFIVDENDDPVEHLGGLHESVLETDPTGREMRPERRLD